MATWVKDATAGATGYYQISTIQRAFVAQWIDSTSFIGAGPTTADNKWYIWIVQDSITTKIKGPYNTAQLAQTDLDNAITNLGGSV